MGMAWSEVEEEKEKEEHMKEAPMSCHSAALEVWGRQDV
jgi:hypothetical protein